MLRNVGYRAKLEPSMVNGTDAFPNQVLCHPLNQDSGWVYAENNNYLRVRADFMLFARSDEYAHNITKMIDSKTARTLKPIYEPQLDVRDVSKNPIKLWNWILHVDEERLAGYNYVWFIDGDIFLRSLNWQAFWQLQKLMKPKISQAGTMGNSEVNKDGTLVNFGSAHPILRPKKDSRIIAAESPIVEIQSPLVEVETWLGYRNWIKNNPEPMELIEQGAEAVFDMAWCHFSRNNMRGQQMHGRHHYRLMDDLDQHRDVSKIPTLSLTDNSNNGVQGRSCVVFYQTPIIHLSKRTISHAGRFEVASELLRNFFRKKHGAISKSGINIAVEIFLAPKY